MVQNINLAGGSLLGVSRGGADISEIVDSIQVIIYVHFLLKCWFHLLVFILSVIF